MEQPKDPSNVCDCGRKVNDGHKHGFRLRVIQLAVLAIAYLWPIMPRRLKVWAFMNDC